MTRRYIAFDIETAKILPEDFRDLHEHRPLGITCAATLCSDEATAQIFYSKNLDDSSPSLQMSQQDLTLFVANLQQKVRSGYTIVTHNGLGFDFDILAEESGMLDECRALARTHVDMMFHFFCGKGFPIALNAAAKALGISKLAGVDGSLAPQLWQNGKYETVLEYVAQDCRLTLDIAQQSENNRRISWVTKKGSTSHFDLPSGWMTVEEALNLPLPDTSWMNDPWPRTKFTNWLS